MLSLWISDYILYRKPTQEWTEPASTPEWTSPNWTDIFISQILGVSLPVAGYFFFSGLNLGKFNPVSWFQGIPLTSIPSPHPFPPQKTKTILHTGVKAVIAYCMLSKNMICASSKSICYTEVLSPLKRINSNDARQLCLCEGTETSPWIACYSILNWH